MANIVKNVAVKSQSRKITEHTQKSSVPNVELSLPSSRLIKDDRFYEIKGKAYPRVTWINSFYPKGTGFDRWMGSMTSFEEAEEVKEAAGRRGTNVHEAIGRLIQGVELSVDNYTDREWEMIVAFIEWVKMYKPIFVLNEQRVVSKKYGYAGTFDALVMIGEQHYLVDYKTSSAIHNSYWCQLAAYNQAAKENGIVVAPHLAILRCGTKHKAGYEWKVESGKQKQFFTTFLAVKNIFHAEVGENPQPHTKEVPLTVKI